VDVEQGDLFSAYAGKVCHASFQNSPLIEVLDLSAGYFRGVRSFRPVGLPADWSLDFTSDGNGTKPIVSDAAMKHEGAAHDLVAMCCGDITRNGGCPVVFNNQLDVATLGKEGDSINMVFRSMITELGEVATAMRIVLFRGETAELGPCVGTDNPNPFAAFNWCGAALGAYLPQLMITGNNVAEGDLIMALRENGFRANGISSVRKAFAMRYGTEWFDHPVVIDQGYLQQAAEPSVLYDPFFTHLNGWWTGSFEPLIQVKKIIHVTGGAFGGKLGDDFLFRRGMSADLPDLFDPPEIMLLCKEWRGSSSTEAYKAWNGGQGALAIISPSDAEDFLSNAQDFGHDAKICGEVTRRDTPSITITSKFDGEVITYS